jgi:hypothetical protein
MGALLILIYVIAGIFFFAYWIFLLINVMEIRNYLKILVNLQRTPTEKQ